MLNRCLPADEVSVTVSHCAFINYTSLLITEAGAHDGMQWLSEKPGQAEQRKANLKDAFWVKRVLEPPLLPQRPHLHPLTQLPPYRS